MRAAVRSERSAPEVYAAGADELGLLDLESGAGLDAALEGVWAVYHLAPNVHPDEVAMAQRVTEAAAAAGVQRLLFHSVLHPDDASMPHHLRKAEAEERGPRAAVPVRRSCAPRPTTRTSSRGAGRRLASPTRWTRPSPTSTSMMSPRWPQRCSPRGSRGQGPTTWPAPRR